MGPEKDRKHVMPSEVISDAIRPTLSEKAAAAVAEMISVGTLFYARNWVLGTSGNFSVVIEENPPDLVITASGVHKGRLTPGDFLRIRENGKITEGTMRPSAEMPIHQAILRERKAGSILHTHSIWATLLTDVHSSSHGIEIEGYEMLKGLSGVTTHEHREWVPILENSQEYVSLSQEVSDVLRSRPDVHGILLRRHGLYTWGKNLAEALRHVEILEFLLEVLGRKAGNRPHLS